MKAMWLRYPNWLRIAAHENWLGTAVRTPWLPALLAAALFSLAGWCLESMAPGAHAIGPALERRLHHPEDSARP